MLEYKISDKIDFELIIEPGPYCYSFKKEDKVDLIIKFTSDEKFNKDDTYIESEGNINTFWINKIGIPCEIIIKNQDCIIDKFDFI